MKDISVRFYRTVGYPQRRHTDPENEVEGWRYIHYPKAIILGIRASKFFLTKKKKLFILVNPS
jgi:hypothetical protein